MANLTEQEFSQHVNTRFRVNPEASDPLELELVGVKGYLPKEGEQHGLERFSAFFTGPAKPFLPQGSYPLRHEIMGSFDLFLVPIGAEQNGFKYEAVFNYFRG